MCDKLRVLTWENNSCYMDSVLFALFSTPNAFLEKMTVQQRFTRAMEGLCGDQSQETYTAFKALLRDMIHNLRESQESKKVCRSFRRFLQTHSTCHVVDLSPPFAGAQQQEAFEFLQFIFSMFALGRRKVGALVVYRKRYGLKAGKVVDWKPWFSREDNMYSLVHRVPYDEFKSHRNLASYLRYTVRDCSLNPQDTQWQGEPVNCFEEHIILQKFADMLILSIERENPATGTVDHEAVQIPSKLTDCTGKSLGLDAVIVHTGKSVSAGHYVCVKKCEDQWFLMDDLRKKLVVYHTWKEVLESKLVRVRTHGVLYFYTI